MRTLDITELRSVSGGSSCYNPCPPPPPPPCPAPTPGRTKNNNGYGNGPESGPPPGNSQRNPTLLFNPAAPTLNAGNHPTRGFAGR